MRCPKCNSDNPEQARFCLRCGTKLTAPCPECGVELPLDAQFCFACGNPVGAAPSDPLADALKRLAPKEYVDRLLASRGQVGHERRIVTILFSDIKGSAAIANQLDPEDVLDVVNGAFECFIPPIFHYEGTLTQLMGDAILAFFGAPIAHDDDPERACRAALDILAAARRYAAKLERERGISGFNVRVGINTGPVVVGEVGTDLRVAYTAVGDTINMAARMEQSAEPGTVLVTEDTYRLVAPLFEMEEMGEIAVKGHDEPMLVYRPLRPKPARKVRGIAGLTSPLVGRERETRALQEAMERLQAGVGGVVSVLGEAGIGKSRLIAEARVSEATPQLQWVEGRCLSYGTAIAYLLWLDVLRNLLGVTEDVAPGAARERLREWVSTLFPEHAASVFPYLARMMSLPLEADVEARLGAVDGQKLKERTFAAVETVLERTASERPLVLVCEDFHWADSISVELLERLFALTDRAPVLFLCAMRPERDRPSWRIGGMCRELYPHRYIELSLAPLSTADSEMLVGNLLTADGLPPSLKERILQQAEGNPFYLEEILRSLMGTGTIVRDEATGRWVATRDVAQIALPDTLQGVLLARIDRLQEDTKRVLQMASVIGRNFLYRVLASIAEEERNLDRHLITLQREDMIRERARIPEVEYIFKHHLVQEAAYNGLLRKERRAYHRQVAEILERTFPERQDEFSGLLAFHWDRAGVPEQAAPYYLRAARTARKAYANDEALALLERGLALVADLPEAEGSRRLAAHLWEGLGDVLELKAQHENALQAYHTARARIPEEDGLWQARLHRKSGIAMREQRLYAQALDACRQAEGALGHPPEADDSAWWAEWIEVQVDRVWAHYWLAQWREMEELVQKLEPVVRERAAVASQARFLWACSMFYLRRDRYVVSDELIAMDQQALSASREWGDPKAINECQFELGFLHVWRRELDAAEEHLQSALAVAQRGGVVWIQALALTYLTVVRRFRGQVDAVQEYAARAEEAAVAAHMPDYVAAAQGNLAWVAWRQGNLAEAGARGRAALERWRGSALVYPFWWMGLWPLIGVALAGGQEEEAWSHVQTLLEPLQQRLPDALNDSLQAATEQRAAGRPEAARNALDQAVSAAKEMGYL